MNNLSTIGQYMTNLQQNISLIAQGLMEVKSEIEVLKKNAATETLASEGKSSNEVSNEVSNKVASIQQDTGTLKSEVANIQQDFGKLKKEVAEMVGKMSSLDQIVKTSVDTSIESIFSSLSLPQQSLIPNTSIAIKEQQPSNETSDSDDTVQASQVNDDIEIVVKKTPAGKKRTTKKTVNI